MARDEAPRRIRVLAIAEAANPEWTSVPLIGWSMVRALQNVADVHLVTHIRNRDAIVRTGLFDQQHFTVIDNERVASPLDKLATRLRGGAGKGWTTNTALQALAYYSFERDVWRTFRDRIVARTFDIVHRITPLSPTNQSLIARKVARAGIPFIVGPLNGGVPWPKDFVQRQIAEREWLSSIRGLYKLMPGYRSMRRNSAAIIVGSRFTLEDMPQWARRKCVYLPENGVDLERFNRPRTHRATLPLKCVFIGRLVPYKGADMLLEAAAEFVRSRRLDVHIIGDGPERGNLESIADREKIRDAVSFHGWIPHSEEQDRLRVCDFLALPSVREFGGGVVLESMALGVAPIVANYAGPSELVDEDIGVRVPFSDKESLVAGLKRAIERVVSRPEILDALGAAGVRRVREKYSWEAKADRMIDIYRAVLSGSDDLPALGY